MHLVPMNHLAALTNIQAGDLPFPPVGLYDLIKICVSKCQIKIQNRKRSPFSGAIAIFFIAALGLLIWFSTFHYLWVIRLEAISQPI